MLTRATRALDKSLPRVDESVRGAVQRTLDDARMCLFGDGEREQHRHLLAPEIQALVEGAACGAAGEMELRLAGLARAGKAEGETRDQRFAGVATSPREPDQLTPSFRHDPLKRALDAARRHAKLLSDRRPAEPCDVQRDDRALTFRQPRKNGARHALDLLVVLPLDQDVLGPLPDAAR